MTLYLVVRYVKAEEQNVYPYIVVHITLNAEDAHEVLTENRWDGEQYGIKTFEVQS